jgi:carbonic anhydrase
MELTRRNLMVAGVAASAVGTMIGGAAVATAAEPTTGAPGKTKMTADQALARLKEGNRRFVGDMPNPSDISRKARLAVAKGQGPFAALIGCADSRVGPEHLFEAGLGELFIVRTAGNYVDTAGLGSIEYAVGVLGVPLIVVLGHERCGAVAAAVDVITKNAQLPGSIGSMVEPILPSVVQARVGLKPGEDLVDASIRANVARVANRLRTSSEPLLLDPIKAGRVKVVGATYDLDTGTVDFFDV